LLFEHVAMSPAVRSVTPALGAATVTTSASDAEPPSLSVTVTATSNRPGRTTAEAGVRFAARWLARLHCSGIRLPRQLSLTQEGNSTRDWAETVGRFYPQVGEQALWLANRWAESARAAAVDRIVPIHKDFHAGHVRLGPGVGVIDLDEARNGDPAFDLAHFCTYLGLTGGREPAADSLHQAFMEEYVAATGWLDAGSYAPFCAYTCLKIAKQWAVGSRPVQGASPAERRAGTVRALAKGEECLTG
jgi:aminoglycoside phosphotransferase (APT) family kinase protein